MVESVLNSKIPDLLEVMEKARTRDGARMDALALRLQEEILAVAGQLQVHCDQMFRDRSYNEEEESDTFDDLWFGLNDLFKKFSNHCGALDI